MASLSFDFTQIFGLGTSCDHGFHGSGVLLVSPWMVWSGFFLSAALVFLGLHFVLRDKPKIDWTFEKPDFPSMLDGFSR